MADVFKALSDTTRRSILRLLREKDLTAGEISDQFQISKPAISKHLEILKNADLVCCEKKGQYITYSINTTALHNTVGEFLDFFEERKEGSSYGKQKN